MQISNNSVVTLTYQLSVSDEAGELETIEIVEQDEPMVFIHGLSGLPEAFEEKMMGLVANDTFDFNIPAEEGYGEFDPEAMVELPIEVFKVEGGIPEGMLEIGNYLPMSDDQGNRLQGKIIAIHADTISMDFNHPLVGKEMHFKGQIVSVRAATEDELDHGHVHGDGGVHH